MSIITYIIGIVVGFIIIYIISRVQMAAWIHGINKFLNNKFEENEQKKEK